MNLSMPKEPGNMRSSGRPKVGPLWVRVRFLRKAGAGVRCGKDLTGGFGSLVDGIQAVFHALLSPLTLKVICTEAQRDRLATITPKIGAKYVSIRGESRE